MHAEKPQGGWPRDESAQVGGRGRISGCQASHRGRSWATDQKGKAKVHAHCETPAQVGPHAAVTTLRDPIGPAQGAVWVEGL